MERRIVTTTRECAARLVPTGDPVTIPSGAFITLTQSLGGTFTVILNGNMARIAGMDADAIGLQIEPLEFPESATGAETVDEEHVWYALRSVFDPEIPVNIYELGLIYKIEIKEAKKVNIDMTLTSPNCPVAESLPNMVKDNILKLEGVEDVDLKLVWDPPWTKDKMSEAAKLELNL